MMHHVMGHVTSQQCRPSWTLATASLKVNGFKEPTVTASPWRDTILVRATMSSRLAGNASVQCFLFHMWKVACLGEMMIMKFKYWYCTDVIKGKGHNGDDTHHATSHQVAYMDFQKQVYDNWGGGHASLCSFNHMKLNQSDLSADELARHPLSLRDPWHTELQHVQVARSSRLEMSLVLQVVLSRSVLKHVEMNFEANSCCRSKGGFHIYGT